MRLLSSLANNSILTVDTGALINLNATGCAAQILRALPHQIVLPDAVLAEFEDELMSAGRDATFVSELLRSDVVRIAALGEKGCEVFAQLVVGPALDTLDDGEAATLAYAVETGGVPVVDEPKARRIWTSRFDAGRIASTVEMLAHSTVESVMGRAALARAVFAALQSERMAILADQIEWVVNLIGPDRAAHCGVGRAERTDILRPFERPSGQA